jgi:16S rRNA processing protein RimM
MVAAGKIGRLFGASGELMITLYDLFPRDLDREEPVFVKIDSLTVPLFFGSFERRGQRGAVVRFDDIDTEQRAAELVGLEFSIRQTDEDETSDDELYMEDLVGWDIEFDTGQVGRITGFVESDYNPLFEVEVGGEQELIPAADDFIVEVDEKHRRVTFSLPEGLLDINKLNND